MAPKCESSVSFSLGGTEPSRISRRCLREALGTQSAVFMGLQRTPGTVWSQLMLGGS